MAERPRQKGGGAEHSNSQKTIKVYDGGDGGSRTHTDLRPEVFETSLSTNSNTSPDLILLYLKFA